MGKGTKDKQNGFWMYMEYLIRPKMEQKLGKRVKAVDLIQFGLPHWTKLSFEEKEAWKERAKECNKSWSKYRQRKHHPKDFAQLCMSQKLKPSKIIPPSRRYDEVDQYSRKYFSGVDDFEGKRENDRKELIDRYQWKFIQKDLESREEFFRDSEIIIVTVNVYYEDSLNERVIPSEISILKFSIKRGIYDHRHYILGFGENRILCKNSKIETEQNEQITGLLMDYDKMSANVRFDYAQIWDEIKAFTRIDGDGVKLLLLSKDWNVVVGSFDALFMHANEKSFSRIETRFATLEDYFMVVYATVHDICVSNEIKADVAREMNESWYRAVFFDLMTCNFHAGLKYTEQCQAGSCSLSAAHEAAGFLVRTRHQLSDLRSSIHIPDCSSVENIPTQSISLLLPKRTTLKSNMVDETASGYDTRSVKPTALERKTRPKYDILIDNKDGELESMTNQIGFQYDVKRWLHNQPSLSNADNWEMGFLRNPHISDASTLDKHYSPVGAVTDQQLFSTSQFTSVSAYRSCQEIPPYRSEGLKSNFVEIDTTKNQMSLNYQFSSDDTEFSNAAISGDLNNISLGNEKDDMLVDLSLIDNDSDAELFCDASIPSSSLCRQGFLIQASQQLTPKMSEGYQNDSSLKTSNKVKQTSAPSSKETGINRNTVKSTRNTYSVSGKSGEVFSKVNQNRIIPSKGGLLGCNSHISSSPQKMRKSPLLSDNMIPERTSGGFCIPNICQTNDSCIRKNRSAASASCGETGSGQNTHKKSGIMANQIVMPRNPHTSNQSLARNEQKERKEEASADKLQYQSLLSSTQPLLVNSIDGHKCTSQKVNIMKTFVLEPLICKEGEMFGWSENVQNAPEQKFIRWLNSAYFEPEISRNSS
ncbi:unnamed protein product [Cercopithifilaria johnstoni]|uniref:Maelstrom domain-containing protein n=1 Tax=Cercopithifilaria johnstoni TaxID=2874296 RepID=A0A8J2M653_9BILA|nr:unnamed protein product [Cercopithifilaria johnstoni]